MPDPIATDARPAASSAAADPTAVPASTSLDALNETELQDWRLTGKLPSDPPTDPDEALDAAPPAATVDADPPASTDATSDPVSEPATPALKAKTQQRIDDLLAERSRERERADRAEQRARDLEARSQPPPQDARPAESSPAAATGLVKPDPETFTYGTADPAYLEALTDYKVAATLQTERRAWETSQQQARAREQQQRAIDAFTERANKARATHADFDAVAMLAPTEIPQGSPADLLILEDEAGAEILYHLQQPAHAAERRRILALAPLAQIKELVRLGDRLTARDPAARSTNAPPPPPTLSTRATPGDPVERALAIPGDEGTRAYIDAENRKELARLKR